MTTKNDAPWVAPFDQLPNDLLDRLYLVFRAQVTITLAAGDETKRLRDEYYAAEGKSNAAKETLETLREVLIAAVNGRRIESTVIGQAVRLRVAATKTDPAGRDVVIPEGVLEAARLGGFPGAAELLKTPKT